MIWDDNGYLISKNRYSENSVIAEIFTKNHGKVSGIIFGGTSKKIRNYLQIGNNLYVNYNSKNANKIGYFKIEISKPLTPLYFDHSQKLSCIISGMNLIKLLTAESQANPDVYNLITNFSIFLDTKNWIKNYIFWELELLKILGYDLELKNIVEKEMTDNQIFYYVKSNNIKKNVPNFLIDNDEKSIDIKNLLKGLKLVSDYLEKSILRPNNINYPSSRSHFVNLLK